MYRPQPLNTAERLLALGVQRTVRRNPRLVAYNSFWGQYSDSPRAIYEELSSRRPELEHVWAVGQGEAPVPATVSRQRIGTARYHRAIGAARFIVANNAMPQLAKRPGATYLQTWHGTPLKRIGFDNVNYRRNPHGLRRVARDYRQWDCLLSQNSYSTEIFRRAFRFEGEIIETGYPRNDLLLRPEAPRVRELVRRQLGVAPDEVVVLYAPTYRDRDRDRARPSRGALDLARMSAMLGPGFQLLHRLHYSSLPDRARRPSGVRDVSTHPDIRELYLAADALITDYSSVMFDFAITRKPIILFLADLEEYVTQNRAHYFDIVGQAPGPVCTTEEDLAVALTDLAAVESAHAARSRSFRERYCYLDDGRASERVVDWLLAR